MQMTGNIASLKINGNSLLNQGWGELKNLLELLNSVPEFELKDFDQAEFELQDFESVEFKLKENELNLIFLCDLVLFPIYSSIQP